jgi:ribosomal protein L37AE/L43A
MIAPTPREIRETVHRLIRPLIHLSDCRSCDGQGHRVINGVMWSCFVCGGSGTKVQQGAKVAA